MPETADRILAAVAASLAENGGPNACTVMTAAVLAHQQPELTACEAAEMASSEMWDEPGRSALAEAKRLLALAAQSSPFDEGEGLPPEEPPLSAAEEARAAQAQEYLNTLRAQLRSQHARATLSSPQGSGEQS